MSNWIAEYHQALLLRLLGIALFLGALFGCRLLARRLQRQVVVTIAKPLVHSDAIDQCTAKKAATRPSLPVH